MRLNKDDEILLDFTVEKNYGIMIDADTLAKILGVNLVGLAKIVDGDEDWPTDEAAEESQEKLCEWGDNYAPPETEWRLDDIERG